MKENSMATIVMEKEARCIPTGINIKGTGLMGVDMDRVYSGVQMEQYMK